MSRRLIHEIPGPDWRIPLEGTGPGDWSKLFESDVPPVVEIGFGGGEFLLELAEQNPDQPFIGIEYSAKRVLKLARRLARTPLTNVRLVEAAAQDVVFDALADEGVNGFWVNFPDPWPKKRHFKRRLIQTEFVALLTRRLVPGGVLEFATDHVEYAEWVDEILSVSPGLTNLHAPRPWLTEPPPGRKPTAYELKWRAEGRGFHFFGYRRDPGP